MESIADRLVFFILGCVFGTGFGYLLSFMRCIKGEVDEILELEHKKDEEGIFERRLAAQIAYTFAMLLVLYAAFVSYDTSNKLEEEVAAKTAAVCRGGVDTRFVQRELVDQIVTLATTAIQPPENRPWTDAELTQINAYIDRVNDFQVNMYHNITPTDACKPYVEDDAVPPPPPVQHVSNRQP